MTADRNPGFPVARRFLVGFEGKTLPTQMRNLLAQGLAGVAVYPRNFTSAEHLASLTAEIRAAARGPVLIGIDQEGGTRFSLPEPFTQWPSPADLGRLGDARAVEEVAHAIGRELSAVGVNLNFAPMVDLHVNPASPVTRVRSYGADPEMVGRMGAAYLVGLRGASVMGCAKHFPGHGDAQVDPHEDLPIYHGTTETLKRRDLVPFAAAIAAGADAIMTAHILLPNVDASAPASLSRRILMEMLREEMGFGGLILADDLCMGAIARRHSPGAAAVAAFAAGADISMFCHNITIAEAAMQQTARSLEAGSLSREEWIAAAGRIEKVLAKNQTGEKEPLDVIGCAEHRVLGNELFERISRLG